LKFNEGTIKPLNSLLNTFITPNASTVQRLVLDAEKLPFKLNDFNLEVKAGAAISPMFRH
jgi:hypothetical protein